MGRLNEMTDNEELWRELHCALSYLRRKAVKLIDEICLTQDAIQKTKWRLGKLKSWRTK